MTRKRKLGAAVTALGLAIAASPASAIPFWPINGGGDSGAGGGDGKYSPYDGRYFLKNGQGQMEFFPNTPLTPGTTTGRLQIDMLLEGQAFNSRELGAQNPVDPGTVLGDFDFSMTYTGAVLDVSPDFVRLFVPSSGSGLGTLTYTTDTLEPQPNGDGSVDGEQEGDVIVFSTPDCAALAFGDLSCSTNFFQWSGPIDGTSIGFSPTDEIVIDNVVIATGIEELPLGERISTDVFSMFNAGLPCTDNADPFFCDPIPDNFPTFDPIEETGGLIIGDTRYDTYAQFVATHPAGIAIEARIAIPEPTMVTLLGIGLAGLSFARRRGKAPNAV
jgi:hypothetical protein